MAASAMITTLDEFEAEYRKGIGYRMPARGGREASIDNIRRFGDGVGDYNPLYRSEEYAQASRFGMVTAPPIFIYYNENQAGLATAESTITVALPGRTA